MQNFTKLLLFTLFFSIGAAALSIAVLYNDLLRYYHYKQLVEQAEQSLVELKAINEEYDELLNNLQSDPRMYDRAAMAVMGRHPNEPNAVYPKASPEQLAAAKQALAQASDKKYIEPEIPYWLKRIQQPQRRLALFLSGSALVLIAFLFFWPSKNQTVKNTNLLRTEED